MLASHFTSASKPSVLLRLHSSANASSLRRPLRRSQQQSRGFRLVVNLSYYHRVTSTATRDIDILNRRLMLCRAAGIPISFGRVAGMTGNVACEKRSTSEVNLQKLKHDSNQTAVYLARTTTFTAYRPKGHDQPRSSQRYIAERNASRKIPRNGPSNAQKDIEYTIPVKKFGGYRPQFQEFKPPTAPIAKESGNILFNKPPAPPAPANSASYVTDSELYLDGRTLDEELNPYYEPVKHNEPDGSPIEEPCPIREALLEYDAKNEANYDGFGYNEPDGKPPVEPCMVEEGLSEYDQTATYDGAKPFSFNEPDGLPIEPICEVETALNSYDQKTAYDGAKPFTFNEPDGLPVEPACAVEAALDQYDQKATYDGAKPFTFNEPDGLPVEPVSEVETALNEYDLRPEANDYKPFAHNEPNGQRLQKPDQVKAALNEYDQKWEPKIEPDNFFFDEDFKNELESIAVTAPKVTSQGVMSESTTSPLKSEAELIGAVPIRKIKTSSGFMQGRKETADEKKARRAKLDSDFDSSSAQFVRDIDAVRKTDKMRHSKKQLEQFEIEASVLLNQYHHLRGKIDARLEELAEEEDKVERREVSTGGVLSSDAESTVSVPFKSGIDVRREEEVCSGSKAQRRRERRRRRGGKMRNMLGGAVAGVGVFYAAGVVSEFFTTGGSEGTGAVGL